MKFATVIVLALLSACSNGNPPEPTEDEARLARTFAELIIHREQFGRAASPDSAALYRAQADSILRKNRFTREEFIESFTDLVESPDRFDALFKRLFTDVQQSPP